MKFITLLFLTFFSLNAATIDEESLKKEIGHMLVVGFEGFEVDANSSIVKDIQNYELGGVILFDRLYRDKTQGKNIASPQQLQTLTATLKTYATKPLLISIDQEGGKVARLKPSYGFAQVPSAKRIAALPQEEAREIYKTQAKMLKENGINCDFAPIVDLAIEPKNSVIVGLERSYGDEAAVNTYAAIFMQELARENIISVLKHFPGHGSSLGDSHAGYVDVSNTWSERELEPYKHFIQTNAVDMIMSAHVFNSHLDAEYPATLSYNTNTKLLREQLGYRGVLISDDMQMGAISKHYSLKERVVLAINSGVDILLFGNQLEFHSTKDIIQTIYDAVQSGAIAHKRIQEANERIANLHTKNAIIQKPVHFSQKRIDLSKEYIKTHYDMNVSNIDIEPKSIVLHWTSIMDFELCFERLKAEEIVEGRKYIQSAGALNVSAHFLVNRDGSIYQLMPENLMARHTIGLNYSAIGIENIGGQDNKAEDLTQAQVEANIRLVRYLKQKYPNIEYLLGHYEYLKMQNTPLWLEKDANYRTAKVDPGVQFMASVRKDVADLGLKRP
ncbi:MAG: glycoside hydrolase family 3 N-terminal domain-containing protein [Sulfurimonas sp.]|nr:glycoside hydrolase family 3 N-terminal domain-containing protein [Sulfurimonas sp.]